MNIPALLVLNIAHTSGLICEVRGNDAPLQRDKKLEGIGLLMQRVAFGAAICSFAPLPLLPVCVLCASTNGIIYFIYTQKKTARIGQFLEEINSAFHDFIKVINLIAVTVLISQVVPVLGVIMFCAQGFLTWLMMKSKEHENLMKSYSYSPRHF